MSDRVRVVGIDAFRAEVIESERPVLVDFFAEWCAPCRALGPIIGEVADEYETSIDVRKVDVDATPELARRYAVRSIPALMIFNGGELVETLVGVTAKGELMASLDKYAD